MASVYLPVLLAILDRIRFAKHHTQRFTGRLASFLVILVRKLAALPWFSGKRGACRKPRTAGAPFLGPRIRGNSVFGCSVDPKAYASTVPASASHSNLYRGDEKQPENSTSNNPPKWTDGPLTVDLSIAQPSLVSKGEDLSSEQPPRPSTPSSRVTSEFIIPENRFLQLIHSEQIPRYTKDVTM